jgi:hypothetical protein
MKEAETGITRSGKVDATDRLEDRFPPPRGRHVLRRLIAASIYRCVNRFAHAPVGWGTTRRVVIEIGPLPLNRAPAQLSQADLALLPS